MNDIGAQQGVAMGNARTQAVRDLNERIRQHNTDVANKIAGLKDQEKTTKSILGAKDTAQALWTGKGMPDKIKAYNDWKAKRAGGQGKTNPKSEEETTQTENAAENEPVSNDATSETQQAAETEAPAEPVAEGAPTSETGAVQSTSEAAEGAEGAVKEGLETAGEAVLKTEAKTAGKTLLGKAGTAAGVLGSAALGGVDLYEDIRDGKIEGNNAWEKASNVLQIGGSLADIVGTVYPPAKLLGGVLDLASAGAEQVGEATDSTTTDELNQEQGKETEQEVGVEQVTQEAGIGVQ
jgi:hypothetical protein